MRRWRALCSAALLFGICLIASCVPASAANVETYNMQTMPGRIEYAFCDESFSFAAGEFELSKSYSYSLNHDLAGGGFGPYFELAVPSGKYIVVDYYFPDVSATYGGVSYTPSAFYCYVSSEGDGTKSAYGNLNYKPTDDSFTFSNGYKLYSSVIRYPIFDEDASYSLFYDSNGNVTGCRLSGTLLYDTVEFYCKPSYSFDPSLDEGTSVVNSYSYDSYDCLKVSVYDSADSVSSTSGTITLESPQVLDDSASIVYHITDLASTESVYSVRISVVTGGEEVNSLTTDLFAGPSASFQLTIPSLTPETEYEVIWTLQEDGVDTTVSSSTTFTTLASTAIEEGEELDNDPNYSNQLNNIEQGLDDVQQGLEDVQASVEEGLDDVQTSIDDGLSGVQGVLEETKEEITSLPQKIATALTDGIKGLFIPSQEDLTEIKTKYEDMLSEKLGFLWQAFDLLTGFVGDLQTNLESGEEYAFTFPGVKLPMQGQEFVLVPETAVSLDNDLMDVLRPVLGTIVSAIAVIAFVNMGHDYVLAIISGISAFQFENRRKGE